ncbi:AAA family ATPase [Candidatus Woesearchaeota archaeon]|nr:AAA family ATPase [Candidatus Woesearchaeota archaeon]
MAKRKFRLPGVEDLNKDQDRVLRLPEDGQFLIVGGPGTGKSVVALLRAMKFSDNDYLFLAYNHTLHSLSKQLTGFDLKADTLKSWFYKLQYKLTKKYMPEIRDRKIDYDKVIEIFKENEEPASDLHILIDEGQDMPIKFYDSLIELGFENFFIVADQNQQITDENSSRKELSDILGLEVKDVIELKQNYRNSHPVALVAQHFFTDKSSPKPELPEALKAALGTPILYEYKDFNQCIKFILREADRDLTNLIGVVVAKTEILDICKGKLGGVEIELDNPRPIIQSYSSKNKQDVNIDFSEGGVVVLNDKSIKGLEFDVVFVMLNGFEIYNNDEDSMRKRLYVMSSRAIKKLIFFQSSENDITKILPSNNILQRKELS